MHAHTNVRTHALKHTCIHTRTQTQTHTLRHTHTQTHTLARTYNSSLTFAQKLCDCTDKSVTTSSGNLETARKSQDRATLSTTVAHTIN